METRAGAAHHWTGEKAATTGSEAGLLLTEWWGLGKVGEKKEERLK